MKVRFNGTPDVSPIGDGRHFVVNAPFEFWAGGKRFVVPKGFVTDFASIPPLARMAGWVLCVAIPLAHRFLWAYALVGFALLVVLISDSLLPIGRWDKTALGHDYLYATHGMSRFNCDEYFWSGTHVEKASVWQSDVMYIALRCFGWKAWGNKTRWLEHPSRHAKVKS
jgi:Protein of unknown function (DUF1353)